MLKNEHLVELLSFLSTFLAYGGEFTIEANPEDVTPLFAKTIIAHGVNRVSIGMQSSDSILLAFMGRNHDYETVKHAVKTLREAGLDNINLDLIYALPNETLAMALEDIRKAIALSPDHISIYSLILEEDSIFSKRGIEESSQDDQASQYEALYGLLEENGYHRYEFSSFAREGKKCRHNLTYWKDEPYYGVGLGASGYVGSVRYKNTVSLPKYLKRKWREKEEEITPNDDLSYFFLTNLRLEEGFLLKDFASRFGFSLLEKYKAQVDSLIEKGLCELTSSHFRMRKEKLILLDSALVELM